MLFLYMHILFLNLCTSNIHFVLHTCALGSCKIGWLTFRVALKFL